MRAHDAVQYCLGVLQAILTTSVGNMQGRSSVLSKTMTLCSTTESCLGVLQVMC